MADVEPTLARAKQLLSTGDLEGSEALFRHLETAGAATTLDVVKTGLGMIALERKEYLSAGRLFLEALQRNPKNADAYYGLGIVAENTAQHYFEKSLSLNPAHRGAAIRVGRKSTSTASSSAPRPRPDESREKISSSSKPPQKGKPSIADSYEALSTERSKAGQQILRLLQQLEGSHVPKLGASTDAFLISLLAGFLFLVGMAFPFALLIATWPVHMIVTRFITYRFHHGWLHIENKWLFRTTSYSLLDLKSVAVYTRLYDASNRHARIVLKFATGNRRAKVLGLGSATQVSLIVKRLDQVMHLAERRRQRSRQA